MSAGVVTARVSAADQYGFIMIFRTAGCRGRAYTAAIARSVRRVATVAFAMGCASDTDSKVSAQSAGGAASVVPDDTPLVPPVLVADVPPVEELAPPVVAVVTPPEDVSPTIADVPPLFQR